MPQSQGARLPAPRIHPPHAAKTMQSRMMFPDRILSRLYLATCDHPTRGLARGLALCSFHPQLSRRITGRDVAVMKAGRISAL